MSVIALFALSLAALVAEQFGVARRLGLPGPLDGGYRSALAMGLAVTAGLTVSMVLCWVMYAFLLAPFGADYLEEALFLLLAAGLAWLANCLMTRLLPGKAERLRQSLPLAAVNCAVLGGALLVSRSETGLMPALRSGLLAGIGFTAAGLLFVSVWERISYARVPRSFSGLPIAMAAAGLAVLTLLGFTGFQLW